MNKKIIFSLLIMSLVWACNETSDSDEESTLFTLLALDQQSKAAAQAAKQCETTYNNNATNDFDNLIELCKPSAGAGRHFRFENVGMTTNNGYLNLLIGYGLRTDTSNFPVATGFGGSQSPTTNSGDGRWRIFAGTSSSCNRSWIVSTFSGTNGSTNLTTQDLFTTQAIATPSFSAGSCPGGANQATGIHGPSTICLDVTKGSNGNSPRVTIWATGLNGADCSNLSTLTSTNSIYEKKDWPSLVETRDDRNFIYRSNDGTSLNKVVVRSETAITD
ncbi:hypothetical protein [Leptospira sp. GIMC2001]|uniref:hypothetical protein n=1 Tax=Leptospira sp. GIMC2001 TaxID=1513297 RepID=UPI0023497C08|nr:hypothetical protein [Leptospira sp. GIMC2001]WCL49117.1 hypothetical protein O4O04_17775 [Leptospira sp. GIMC2001]